ncbi:polysaccharide biosynthesis protein [Halpernia frigidisoli]|uniref:NDP-sugar epimerase, includes UDP-GlcNAc-inverting 4,6-dehydratase FlaA1 and capsular polysaccharide biosynthesis protein EpsC n=1 Tax=Halpernia frigidisoli TaxID=1125876 RepID=A0A1I3FDS5_9FLAO|nr:nucleoside-diphosphate sugar epimerase/dehydratase [Halpernia frigidisoli]SFI09376.1 NDP-sugar epimerase, includes UDP-GlcNAc-inverting 4,6-dehydratase FlaA1 and capsular polysaccharide biosynthesis protein EpsC [Halpernia frigidisoli]
MNFKTVSGKIYDGDNFLKLSDVRYLPRWIVILIDVILIAISLFISYFVVAKLNVSPATFLKFYQKFFIILGVNLGFMFWFRTYSGIIRHSTFVDLWKIFLTCFSTGLTLTVISYISLWFFGHKLFFIPILFIYFALSFTSLFVFRLVVKEFFQIIREMKNDRQRTNILILEIGESSVAIARAIIANPNVPYSLKGFVTSRKDSTRALLLGKKIYTRRLIEKSTKEELGLDGVIIIKELISPADLESWVSLFLEKDLKIFKSPSVQKFRDNDFAQSIKSLQIEDLLNRKAIKIDNEAIQPRHLGKTILVTGGAGSIGSEIVRQVAKFSPACIVVLDQAETPLYDIELEMLESFPKIRFEFILADISNRHRLEPVFQKYNFSMVYHAAAYKHVPLVEKNPHEAILVNILGTKNLSNLSSKYKVNRFVMISTDKAVNPTNVMGASKRSAELYVQSLQNIEGNVTKFITTRFGNVLGSNGSVIPHFKRQIEAGGPITVTHKDIVRYFMTIQEACELVLQAGTMGKGGEIFVFDMGQPVKIVELAKRMIRLSGLKPDEDIDIVFTGLRPGEKLYEELLSDDSKTQPTHHSGIMISKDPSANFEEITKLTNLITKAALRRDNADIVVILKKIVPEFKSQNSVFEKLDI